MNNETIQHEGIITKVTDTELEVKIVAQSACAGCHARGACGMGDKQEKVLVVPRTGGQDFHVLEKVRVGVTVEQGNRAAVLAYLIPFIILVAVLFILLACGMDEGLSALLSIAALIPYYVILYICRGRLKQRFHYEVEKI